MVNPVPQGFVGSNPTSSIETSLRCPSSSTENLILGIQHQISDSKSVMRNPYTSKVRLERWMHRLHTELPPDNETDKHESLKFIDYKEKDKKFK
jgi:hypothetical protein